MQKAMLDRWMLIVPMGLAVFAAFQGLDSLSPSASDNVLVAALGNPGASIAGGFVPATVA